jgi:hypothetical protein
MRILAARSLLEEAHDVARDTTEVALAVGRDDAEKALAGLLGEIGLLEDALGGVDVGEVEGGSRMARVEDGCKPYSARERPYHDAVHFVVCNVSDLAEIDWVDNLIEAVFFVAVEILGLPAMA